MILRVTTPSLIVARDADLDLAYHARSIHRVAQRGIEVRSSRRGLHVALCFLAGIAGSGPVLGEVEDGGDEVRDEDLTQEEGGVVHFMGGGGVVHGVGVGGGGVRGGGSRRGGGMGLWRW